MKAAIPLLLGSLLALAVLAPSGAAGGGSDHHAATDVDPLVRHLYLVSGGAPFGLRTELGEEKGTTYSFAIGRGYQVSTCGGCTPSKMVLKGAYLGDDFDVEVQPSIHGRLHFTWTYSNGMPLGYSFEPRPYATIYPVVYLGGIEMQAQPIHLQSVSGEFNKDIVFGGTYKEVRTQAGNSSHHHHPPAHDADIETMGVANLTIGFTVVLHHYGTPWELMGKQLRVKVDTGGGTWLVVREVPPPPPPPPEPVLEETEAVGLGWEDTNGDGVWEIHFLPGFEAAAVAMGLVAGLLLRRRSRA